MRRPACCSAARASFATTKADWNGFAEHGVRPSLESLRFVARAITPPGRVRRFDTRFFAAWREDVAVALADGGPTNELEEIVWLPIEDAQQADIPLITKTVLQGLAERLRKDPELAPGGPVPFYRLVGKSFVNDVLCGAFPPTFVISSAAAWHIDSGRLSRHRKRAIGDPTATSHHDERRSDQRAKRRAYALAVDRRGDRLDQRCRHRHRARHAAAQLHPGGARPFGDDDRPQHGGGRHRLDRRSTAGHAAGHRFGVVWTMLAMILVGAFAFLGFYFAPSFWMWFPLRAILHVALTVLFILSEFWISMSAPPHRRGFVLGIYATVLSLGFAFGPWLYAQMGSTGFLPFGVTFVVVLLAAIPVLAAAGESPEIHTGDEPVGFFRYIWLVPTATAAVLVFGAVETGGFALFPIYGNRIGYSESDAALLLSMIGLGNVILQIPIGMLSDRIGDRRILLAACATVGLAGMLALPWFATNWPFRLRCCSSGAAWSRRSTPSAWRISAPDLPAASSPRPTPPSCSATVSACWSARRRSVSAWTSSAPTVSAIRWRCSSPPTSCSPSRASRGRAR